MNVFRLRGEQIRVNGLRKATTLSKIEANRGFCRCRRDVDRDCAVGHGDVSSSVPKSLRGTSSAVGARDVQERQPSDSRLERRVNNRETGRALPIRRAEK